MYSFPRVLPTVIPFISMIIGIETIFFCKAENGQNSYVALVGPEQPIYFAIGLEFSFINWDYSWTCQESYPNKS